MLLRWRECRVPPGRWLGLRGSVWVSPSFALLCSLLELVSLLVCGVKLTLSLSLSPSLASPPLSRPKQLPSILPIHLVRSNYYTTSGAYKNTCQVTFPEFLDLGAFSDHPTSSSAGDGEEQGREQQAGGEPIGRGRDLYRLSSLVVHYGSHHFGHYVAFRRRPTTTTTTSSSAPSPSTSPRPALQQQQQPEWYRISDETVSPSTISEVLRANPVLMFYERWEGDDGLGEGGRSRRGARGVRPRVVRRWEVGGGKASEGESGGEKAKDGRREKKEAGEGGSL